MTCSALDGYRAAASVVRRMLDDAAQRRPLLRSWKMQRLAAYREGYYEGLLAAHCQHAMGEHPEHNAEDIRKELKQNAKVDAPSGATANSLDAIVGALVEQRKEQRHEEDTGKGGGISDGVSGGGHDDEGTQGSMRMASQAGRRSPARAGVLRQDVSRTISV